MPVNLRLYHSGVSGMKSLFDKKVENHRKTQLENPFSEWEGAGEQTNKLSKDDAFYGRPLPGSDSERRAQAAHQHIMMDIKYLCDMIWDCAEWRSPDGRSAITFGKLFNLYNAISDKVVGTLLRARKHGFVYFEGEMLYQKRDDNKVIELSRNINTIRNSFGAPPVLTGEGGQVDPWCTDDDIEDQSLEKNYSRRNSLPVNSVKPTELPNQRRKSTPQAIPHDRMSLWDNAVSLSLVQEEAEIAEEIISEKNKSENIQDQNSFSVPAENELENISSNYDIISTENTYHVDDNPDDNLNYNSIQSEKENKGIINGNKEKNMDSEEENTGMNADKTLMEKSQYPDQTMESLQNEKTEINSAEEENPEYFVKPNSALKADIVSLLGQFACNLTLAKSSKGMISEEISNTANKLQKLFCLQSKNFHS